MFLFFSSCRYPKPISVARRVLEHPSLSMLVGVGATKFAEQQGMAMETNDELLTQQTRQAFQVLSSWNVSVGRVERGEGNKKLYVTGKGVVFSSFLNSYFSPCHQQA